MSKLKSTGNKTYNCVKVLVKSNMSKQESIPEQPTKGVKHYVKSNVLDTQAGGVYVNSVQHYVISNVLDTRIIADSDLCTTLRKI